MTIYNVKDPAYGAKGDGLSDDSIAIRNAAVDAVTNHGVLYFPAGTYLTNWIQIGNANGLTIRGDGMGVSTIKSLYGGRVLEVDGTSSRVTISDLTIDGNCTKRTAGGQGIIVNADYSKVERCEVTRTGEFAIYCGDTACRSVSVLDCFIHGTFSDGIHFSAVNRGTIADNIIDGADDDCIALVYNGNGFPNYINVHDNFCYSRNDLGTNWGRGMAILRANNCTIRDNYVENAKQYGLWVYTDDPNFRCTNLTIADNVFKECCVYSGHAVALHRVTNCYFFDNVILDPINGNCLDIADWQNLVIQGGFFRQIRNQFCRAIHCDESTGIIGPWASTWTGLSIIKTHLALVGAGTWDCIDLSPNATVNMDRVLIDGNTGECQQSTWIFVNPSRVLNSVKIVNNTCFGNRSVNPPGSSGIIVCGNNN